MGSAHGVPEEDGDGIWDTVVPGGRALSVLGRTSRAKELPKTAARAPRIKLCHREARVSRSRLLHRIGGEAKIPDVAVMAPMVGA